MKNYTFLLLFILSSTFSTSFGQNIVTDTSATVVAYFEPGEKAIFSRKASKVKKDGDGKVTTDSATTYFSISVDDATDSTYNLTWKWDLNHTKLNTTQNDVAGELVKLLQQLEIKYETDELGTINKILNDEEIANFGKSVTDGILESVDEIKTPEAKKMVTQFFSNNQLIMQGIMRDPNLYHGIYGLDYVLHERLELEVDLPVPIGNGNKVFPGILSLELTEINKEKNECVVVMKQELDKEKSSEAISDIIKELSSGKMNQPLQFSVTDEQVYTVDLETGWIKHIFFQRKAISGDLSSTETIIIEKQ